MGTGRQASAGRRRFCRRGEDDRRTGRRWISSGALGSLASLADCAAANGCRSYPRALAHRAEVARLRGEYELGPLNAAAGGSVAS